MTLVDTHCHLTDEKLLSQAEGLVVEAKAAGVEKIIAPSVSLDDSLEVVKLVSEHPSVYGLIGIHPENLTTLANLEEAISSLSKLLDYPKIVGIGEIGLDFYRESGKESLKQQLELCGRQLQLALDKKQPTAIHVRAAETETIALLKDFRYLPSGQFHCFDGDLEFLELVLERGFYVSFCGNITYSQADRLRQACRLVPIDRLLLETDSPYLAPQSRRGQVNTPANVKITAEFIASLLDLPIEKLAQQTSANAYKLYRLNDETNSPTNSQVS
jgi:TatD DNase family protein